MVAQSWFLIYFSFIMYKLNYTMNISSKDIYQFFNQCIDNYKNILPNDKNSKILIKPNFNSNMNALTGNTTDLRLLSVAIKLLKDLGYSNIVIGEGTNSGFYRNNINVMQRLKVDELAKYYGVLLKDFNYSQGYDIELTNRVKVSVAQDCFESDLFINMPKMKTHFEVGMSICLKNLIGCLIGQENKKKMHSNLAENILVLNQYVQPHLHVVYALVAMQGLGPTRGSPIRMDLTILGNNPFIIDLFCARLANFNYTDITPLKCAQSKGLIGEAQHGFVDGLDIKDVQKTFDYPDPGIVSKIIHHPKRQKYFLRLRETKLFSYLASTKWFGKLLYQLGLRQDQFLSGEMECTKLYVDQSRCKKCLVCINSCPLYINAPQEIASYQVTRSAYDVFIVTVPALMEQLMLSVSWDFLKSK